MRWYTQDPCDAEGWHDQNADTALLPHGYWSLCLADDRQNWRLRLWEQNSDLDEIINEPYTGSFPTEAEAKAFAQACETQGALRTTAATRHTDRTETSASTTPAQRTTPRA